MLLFHIKEVVGHTAPQSIICSCLQVSWHTTRAPTITIVHRHTATPSHGIGGHYALLLAFVGQDYGIFLGFVFFKIKGAQVEPRTSTHFLIDVKVCLLPLVAYDVVSITHALGQAGITHIDGICATYLESWRPCC